MTPSRPPRDRRQEVLTIAWSAEVLTLASEVLTYVRGPHDAVHGGSADACSPLATPARVASPLAVGFLVFPFGCFVRAASQHIARQPRERPTNESQVDRYHGEVIDTWEGSVQPEEHDGDGLLLLPIVYK